MFYLRSSFKAFRYHPDDEKYAKPEEFNDAKHEFNNPLYNRRSLLDVEEREMTNRKLDNFEANDENRTQSGF